MSYRVRPILIRLLWRRRRRRTFRFRFARV